MVSTYTTNKHIEKPGNNDYVDTWNVPVNNDWDIIDRAFGGTYTVSLSSSNVTLTQANCQNVCILLTGVLTANVTVYLPSGVSGFFIFNNTTTGSYTVTVSSAGGGAYSALAVKNANTFIWTNGTNAFLADNAPLVGSNGITVNGTSVSLDVPVSVARGGTGQTSYTAGQLLIGNNAGGLSAANITAGANVVITNGNGTITIASTGGGGAGPVANPFAVSWITGL